MKKLKTIIPLAGIAAMALTAESCVSSGSGENIEFTTRADSVAYLVPDYFGDTCYVASRYSVVWPEKIGKQDFDAMKDSLISMTFKTYGNTSDFDVAAKQFQLRGFESMGLDSTIASYGKAPYASAMTAHHITSSDVESTVSLLTPDVLVIDIFSYGYVDRSAHGMQTRRFLNYSIKEHTLLTADKMFKPESADSISTLIAATAAKKYPEGTLFSDAKFPLTNFKITEQEIVFIYQPYDVGPYAAGIIEIPISQHTLQPYMTPTAISTLGLESR